MGESLTLMQAAKRIVNVRFYRWLLNRNENFQACPGLISGACISENGAL